METSFSSLLFITSFYPGIVNQELCLIWKPYKWLMKIEWKAQFLSEIFKKHFTTEHNCSTICHSGVIPFHHIPFIVPPVPHLRHIQRRKGYVTGKRAFRQSTGSRKSQDGNFFREFQKHLIIADIFFYCFRHPLWHFNSQMMSLVFSYGSTHFFVFRFLIGVAVSTCVQLFMTLFEEFNTALCLSQKSFSGGYGLFTGKKNRQTCAGHEMASRKY